ncbi:MAG: hypothetical protein COT74_12405 [Bdellovibrionales bacterium CG10_big_fil_rev_8_21_14_0_10_45_34]|nr:MAG: hypothetical protein COT74_12405 [Bdellovibrionales bacterium CG10_big_fil_rev_8_21_14_0_10_45_34]
MKAIIFSINFLAVSMSAQDLFGALCDSVQGRVKGYNEHVVKIENLQTRVTYAVQIKGLPKGDLEFFKENVNRLVDTCLPGSFIRRPASK